MKHFVMAVILLSLFSSCATLVSGTKNTVNIRTDPPMADVSIKDRHGKEVYSGKGQAVVRLKKGAGFFVPAKYTITINAAGYQERIVEINSTINGWYFANIFIGGTLGMLIIDPATGGMWKSKNMIIDEKLDKSAVSAALELQVTDINCLTEEQKTAMVRIR